MFTNIGKLPWHNFGDFRGGFSWSIT